MKQGREGGRLIDHTYYTSSHSFSYIITSSDMKHYLCLENLSSERRRESG